MSSPLGDAQVKTGATAALCCPRCGGYVHGTRWHSDEPHCLNCGWRDHPGAVVDGVEVVKGRFCACGADIQGLHPTAKVCARCIAARANQRKRARRQRTRQAASGRSCGACRRDISDLPRRAVYCEECRAARKRASDALSDSRRRPSCRVLNCEQCGQDIQDRPPQARFCKRCSAQRFSAAARLSHDRWAARVKGAGQVKA